MPNICNPASANAAEGRTVPAIVVAVLVTALCLFGVWPAVATVAGRTHTVVMEGMKFSPPTLRIRYGDTVVFRNNDLVPHTATAKQRDGFDSGIIKPGESWTFVPKVHATMPYVCVFHPTMEGRIEMERP
jgi:plastocyanin